MDPADARALLLEDVQEVLGQYASGLPVARLSAELERAGRVFQSLACLHLLDQLDAEAFRANLLRAVHARLAFLRRSRREGNTKDRRLALSRTEALFDALAAGHDATLRALVEQSIDQHVPGWEYEEDFHYWRWLQALLGGADTAALRELGRQRRAALQAPPDARQHALEALGAADADAFVAALHRLSDELTAQADERQAQLQEFDLEACIEWPRGFVSVELLALIALAARRGMRVEVPIALAPLEGRLAPRATEVEDFFIGIERVRAADAAASRG